MKYNKASLNDTLRVALILANKSKNPRFVFATGYGYKIDINIPPFAIKYFSVNPDGKILHGSGVI